jgi:hypothetical protein
LTLKRNGEPHSWADCLSDHRRGDRISRDVRYSQSGHSGTQSDNAQREHDGSAERLRLASRDSNTTVSAFWRGEHLRSANYWRGV